MADQIKQKKSKYYLNQQSEFVIENYNYAKPFASFFPGIAGKFGIPMWAFYVNRGQAIASFGTKDKDRAILEFFPANKSWQLTPLQGFRTFIKVASGKKNAFYEPFHNGHANIRFDLTNRMSISSYDLKIEEINVSLGLKINVEYFTIPGDSYAALTRIVTIRNTSRGAQKIKLLDGLPQIIPFGMNNWLMKEMSRTIEAWMVVQNLQKNIPFYQLAVDSSDRPEVIHIKEGNFYLSYHFDHGRPKIIAPIVEPERIFGPVSDFSCPYEFMANKNFMLPKDQLTRSITPCGFTLLDLNLDKGEEKSFYSLIGHAQSVDLLNSLSEKIVCPSYLEEKRLENKEIINKLEADIDTKCSSQEFNLYTKQTYLDNILRGGYPTLLGPHIFYMYSRKHGDLERDYNRFQTQPTYFSQGNGNYRDVNQNRRMDVWFNPEVKDDAIITFFNLLQTDGFNPLVVKGVTFILSDNKGLELKLKRLLRSDDIESIKNFTLKPFTPGELTLFIRENKIKITASLEAFLNIVFSFCQKHESTEHGEGFWTDHWTYNLDLLESYFSIYPEDLSGLVFKRKIFTYFDNSEIVRPRNEKYQLYHGQPRQLHSVTSDNHKKELIKKRSDFPHVTRTNFGEGEIYQTSLANKMLCLLVNKIASLDPFGVGIEMEANKPGWYDALNGLPALFGSSSCETFELKRLIIFMIDALNKTQISKITFFEELNDFMLNINRIIDDYFEDGQADDRDFKYWDKACSLKESYRKKTLLGISGKEIEVSSAELMVFLKNALKKVNSGLDTAVDKKDGIYYAYFINEVAEYTSDDNHFIRPTKFVQKKLPYFLESQVHALRLAENIDLGRKLHKAVSKSQLFDKELKMYKVNSTLGKMPEEIGRCRVFAPGWLENESIWLHMEYKYLLELLKIGLSEEFYENFKLCLVPFQNPQKYGRSILENSSFIVSSAFPDKRIHGNGFVARLSGSTAEFLQIWALMNIGRQPFSLDKENRLLLKFAPQLAGWLFTKKDKIYSFNFLSKIKVVYHNPRRLDTFGKNKAVVKKIVFYDKDSKLRELELDTIPSPYAEQVRSRLIKQIDIYLG